MFKSVLNEIINFILPNTCICCEASIDTGARFICRDCYQKLEKFEDIHPWKDEYTEKGVIDNSLSAFWFREQTEIQKLMHAMKYRKMKSIGKLFGGEIGRRITSVNKMKFDYVIPVPLHRAKVRERTYNQSDYIAAGIGETIGAEVLRDTVKRTRFTKSQTRLDKPQRKENVSGAFEINPKQKDKITGKNIIVADDVITTGATILECAKVLKVSGAGKIWLCSAAYAVLDLS
jgi:ComF family protein